MVWLWFLHYQALTGPSLNMSYTPYVEKTTMTRTITQIGHSFAVGDLLKFTTSIYSKAQANNDANARVVGMVSSIISANIFVLCEDGYVSGLSSLTINSQYFLSASAAGAMTVTEPSAYGTMSKPLFYSISATEGYFVNNRSIPVRYDIVNGTKKFLANEYFATGTVAGGTATFWLTDNGLSSGVAVFTTVFKESASFFIDDSAVQYQFGNYTLAADKRSVTATINRLSTTSVLLSLISVLTGITFIAAANGVTVHLRIKGE